MIVSILITSICMWLAYVLLCRRYFPVNEQVATYPGKWPLIGHVYKFTSSIGKHQYFHASSVGTYSITPLITSNDDAVLSSANSIRYSRKYFIRFEKKKKTYLMF